MGGRKDVHNRPAQMPVAVCRVVARRVREGVTQIVNQALAREFGLSADEYAKVLEIMGRTPIADRARRVQRHVVGALLLQILPRLAAAAADQGAPG